MTKDMDKITQAVVAEVSVLKLEPGDILAIKLGITNMGDGLGPWIPSTNELKYVRDDVNRILPDGVKVVITHMGVNYEIIRGLENIDTVKVESIPDAT